MRSDNNQKHLDTGQKKNVKQDQSNEGYYFNHSKLAKNNIMNVNSKSAVLDTINKSHYRHYIFAQFNLKVYQYKYRISMQV